MLTDEEVRITLRLPTTLRDTLAQAAAVNARSMNSEIVSRLSDSFDPSAISEEFSGCIAALHASEALIEALRSQIAALERALKDTDSVARHAEFISAQFARAVLKAADGDPSDLTKLVEQAKLEPHFRRYVDATEERKV